MRLLPASFRLQRCLWINHAQPLVEPLGLMSRTVRTLKPRMLWHPRMQNEPQPLPGNEPVQVKLVYHPPSAAFHHIYAVSVSCGFSKPVPKFSNQFYLQPLQLPLWVLSRDDHLRFV